MKRGLCVGPTDMLCKNGQTDWDVIWGSWLLWVQ